MAAASHRRVCDSRVRIDVPGVPGVPQRTSVSGPTLDSVEAAQRERHLSATAGGTDVATWAIILSRGGISAEQCQERCGGQRSISYRCSNFVASLPEVGLSQTHVARRQLLTQLQQRWVQWPVERLRSVLRGTPLARLPNGRLWLHGKPPWPDAFAARAEPL